MIPKLLLMLVVFVFGPATAVRADAPDPPPEAAVPAPGFLDIEPISLDQWSGRVLVLDFWASWCAPCAREIPWLESQRTGWAESGATIVGVCLDPDLAPAVRFLDKHPARFPMIHDPKGQLAERFDIQGMPTTVLLDRNGEQRFRHTGFRDADRDLLIEQIRTLCTESLSGETP